MPGKWCRNCVRYDGQIRCINECTTILRTNINEYTEACKEYEEDQSKISHERNSFAAENRWFD